ncbi:hypothetical protein BX616_005180, partial [Lobosporangium transversale]
NDPQEYRRPMAALLGHLLNKKKQPSTPNAAWCAKPLYNTAKSPHIHLLRTMKLSTVIILSMAIAILLMFTPGAA